MNAPSSKTLLGIAITAFVVGIIVFPAFGPIPIPTLGPNGSVLHGPDGSVILHHDMRRYYEDTLPSDILFLVSAVFVTWLIVRYVRNHKKAA